MADLYWLCRLDWSGRTLHWATAAVSITDDLGVIRRHAGGLSVSYEASLELFGSGTSIPSVTIGALPLPQGLDAAALIEQGHTLDGSPIELALWWDDQDYEEREVIVTGRARLPAYGAPGEPFEFGVEVDGMVDEGRIIGPAEVVSQETWPFARDDDNGRTYPRVYGRPGMGREITRPKGMTTTSTFEAPLVHGNISTLAETHLTDILDLINVTLGYQKGATFLLLAGHPITAALIRLYFRDEALGLMQFDQPVVTLPDRLGHVCSVCETPTAFTDAEAYYVDYAADIDPALLALYPGEGGVRSRYVEGEAMYGLGEILLDLLTFSTIPVDWQAFNAQRSLLDRFRLDFFIDDPGTSPLDFIQSNIAGLFPVSLVLGPRGLYPVVWLPDEQGNVASLTAGRGLHRISAVEYEGEVQNEISLSYAPNFKGTLRRRVTMTGGDIATPVVDTAVELSEHLTISSAYARASHTRHGRRARPTPLESIVIYDQTTACAVVSWQARAHAQPWRSIRYDVDPGLVSRRTGTRGGNGLRLGDYVWLVDDELSIRRRAVVRGIAWTDCNPEVDLLLIDGPQWTASADLTVSRSGTEIEDGDNDALGNVPAAGGTSFTYTLRNTGSADLEITATTIVDLINVTSTATTEPASTVQPGASTSCVVLVDPTGAGAFSGSITWTTNCRGAKASFAVGLTGTGT